ncbi:MAG: PKD domain-containing protein, partial [bacterium]|nr:PKD domain-containing protein [bacterium]
MRIHYFFLIASVLIIVGCSGHGSHPVTPNPPQNPVAVAKADSIPRATNIPISFSGSNSYDPDGGDIKLFEWDWNNDGTYDETGENVVHSWSEFGTYPVQLRVTDDDLQVDMLDKPLSVEIATVNPVSYAEADPNPQAQHFPVSFSGSKSHDPDGGEIQLFEWDWNSDGICDDTGENVDHTWDVPGTYLVQLRVTDDEGQVDIMDFPLQVEIAGSIDGNLIWAKHAGGENSSYSDLGYAIATLSDNSIVVTGVFEGSATFGLGAPN